jgi:hypothetical protein
VVQVSSSGTAAQRAAIEISGIMTSQTIISFKQWWGRSACLHYRG